MKRVKVWAMALVAVVLAGCQSPVVYEVRHEPAGWRYVAPRTIMVPVPAQKEN